MAHRIGRRAKIKNLAKKSIETGEDCDEIPESMRKYLTMQALESGKPIVRDMINVGMSAHGTGLLMNTQSNASKVGMLEHLFNLIVPYILICVKSSTISPAAHSILAAGAALHKARWILWSFILLRNLYSPIISMLRPLHSRSNIHFHTSKISHSMLGTFQRMLKAHLSTLENSLWS